MKSYIVSLLCGILMGGLYGLLKVRSPAPPTIALVGLLGMLLGEQMIPLAKQFFSNPPPSETRAAPPDSPSKEDGP